MAFLAAENENRQAEFLIFSSWVRQRTFRLLFGDFRSFCFHSSLKSTFLDNKGLMCLYDKQNRTWLLVDMKFLSRVQLDISLVRCAHSWAIEVNLTRREFLYLRATMYYSLYIRLRTMCLVSRLFLSTIPPQKIPWQILNRLMSQSEVTSKVSSYTKVQIPDI